MRAAPAAAVEAAVAVTERLLLLSLLSLLRPFHFKCFFNGVLDGTVKQGQQNNIALMFITSMSYFLGALHYMNVTDMLQLLN